MATSDSKKNEASAATNKANGLFKDGFQTIVQAHNEWLDLAAQQQTKVLEAMQDGLKQYAAIYEQAETEYRKAIKTMSDKLNGVIDRTTQFGL